MQTGVRWLVKNLLYVAVVLLVACGGHDLQGTISLTDSALTNTVGQTCKGLGGYDDIREGTEVVVKDDAGKILATSSLKDGHMSSPGVCDFKFTVAAVPDANFYQVEVSHRGAVTYSKADLEGKGWKIALTLGH